MINEETKQRLSPTVRDALETAVLRWADENLPGRPAILAHAVYFTMERTLLEEQAKIEAEFPET